MRPELLLILLIGGIYGALFYLWRGKSFRDLLVYILTAIVGFALGHVVGEIINLDVFTIGRLHVVEATLVSWGLMFIGSWLKV
jgi:hypothetical protein